MVPNSSKKSPILFALIVAAGSGTRMQCSIPKQYLDLLGKPVLRYSLDAFLACKEIKKVFIAVAPNDKRIEQVIDPHNLDDPSRVSVLYCGAKTRQQTVLNALYEMKIHCHSNDRVLVHDAARPGITPELISRLFPYVSADDGALLALPLADTLKKKTNAHVQTQSREGLWRAQTPQMFAYEPLVGALEQKLDVTDESQAMELAGFMPELVMGHWCNNKLTIPEDFTLISLAIRAEQEKKECI